MSSLRIKKIVTSILINAMIGAFVSAQIATPQGEIQGGNRGDTAHFVDKPSMHVHEETTVIPEKHAGKAARAESSKNGGGQAVDTTSQAHAPSTAPTDSMGSVTNGEIGGGNTNMGNMDASTTTTSVAQNMSPVYAALTAFGIGALIGLFLLAMVLQNKKTSRLMALLHGALGLVGIGMLIVYSMFYSGLVVSVVILAIAATGGLILFYKDVSNEPMPKWLAVGHGLIAVVGVVTLIVYAVAK